MVSKEKIEAKIEVLQYLLDYECDCSMPAHFIQHMEKLIKEYKILLNDL